MNTKSIGFLFIIACLRFSHCKRYDNYTLYNVTPMERYQLKFLQNLEAQKYIDVIFWKRPFRMYNDVQLIVNPTDLDLFQERILHFKLDATILLPDVQKAFDKQIIKKYTRLHTETFSWNHYHNLEDVYQWLADVAIKYPKIAELNSIGKSAEGRDIYVISIKKGKPKAKVIIEGSIHGNEWVSTAFVTYLINELLHSERSSIRKFKEIANKYHWFLIPILNPDGFAYSIKEDRLWRKNRRPLGSHYGVDLNRNFGHEFATHGTSKEPLDAYYCGPKPFSEPEAAALADFITKKKDKLNFYFAFHAYGQKIIIPFADRVKHVDNFAEMMSLDVYEMLRNCQCRNVKEINVFQTMSAREYFTDRKKSSWSSQNPFLADLYMAKENYGKQAILKMYKLNGVKYSIGTIYDTLGFRISGNSASWVKKVHKTKYVMSFLLRDNGSYGFALPPEQILPSCKETLTGLSEIMTARHRRIATILFNAGQTILVNFCLLLFLVTFTLINFM